MLRYGIVLLAAIAAFPQAKREANLTDREKLSQIGTRVLEEAEKARVAIARKETQKAQQYVNDALTDVLAIEALKPHAKQPQMVPLYTENIQISVMEQIPSDKKKAASPPSTGSANRAQVVHDATGESTSVSLNVTAAKAHLETAKNAMAKGDPAAADGALAAIQSDVKAQSVAADLPLLKARKNLALALGFVRQQQYDKAVAPLREAASALGDYSGTKLPQAADAGKLRQSVDALAGTIEQNHTDAENKIARWWNQVSDWFTRPQAPAQ